jgi:hypothetical protein
LIKKIEINTSSRLKLLQHFSTSKIVHYYRVSPKLKRDLPVCNLLFFFFINTTVIIIRELILYENQTCRRNPHPEEGIFPYLYRVISTLKKVPSFLRGILKQKVPAKYRGKSPNQISRGEKKISKFLARFELSVY